MNRGKLEAWAARLFMILNDPRFTKEAKAEELRTVKIRVTRLSESGLINWIEYYLTEQEAM